MKHPSSKLEAPARIFHATARRVRARGLQERISPLVGRVPSRGALLLTFYGDDFTGSTDALEQLTLAGIRTLLFIRPPSEAQLRKFPGLQAVGVAGLTRSMTPAAMEKELRPAFKKLKALGAPHVHYKVCSTFDSSPQLGSIGFVIDLAVEIFRAPFVPLLVAAPALGRYTVFGTHFARFGIGSDGDIHRLDRHPAISKHPITPMTEADVRLHLAKQTNKKTALFDILKIALPEKEARAALQGVLAGNPDVILFDALYEEHLPHIGGLIAGYASVKRPLFSVGSSGIEMALAAHFRERGSRVERGLSLSPSPGPRGERVEERGFELKDQAPPLPGPLLPRGRSGSEQAQCQDTTGVRSVESSQNLLTSAATKVLIGSGSCSPVTARQIAWAFKNGFVEVALNVLALTSAKTREREIERAGAVTAGHLRAGSSVVVHTTRAGSNRRISAKLKHNTARILGTALGRVLRGALEQAKVHRLCVAGGDTSSFAARALGIEALEMIAPLTPGAPLCRAIAPDSPADGLEVVFKGGQVGAENYFEIVKCGKI